MKMKIGLFTPRRTVIVPEDRKELARLVKATDMAIVLFEIQHNLRKKTDWLMDNIETGPQAKYKAHEIIWECIFEEFQDWGINTEELID